MGDDILTVYMSTLTYCQFYLFIFYICFGMRRESVIRFGCHYFMNLNSNVMGYCICVHQGIISAAAGPEAGRPYHWALCQPSYQ